jgi:cellulose synthase/poly-beta-1,6-N-acetylglucosamine synthase-like glycosyltransferase
MQTQSTTPRSDGSAHRTVSIVTVTQYSRRHVLPLLVECIARQTVAPTEWVVVEGSRHEGDAQLNAALIADLEKRIAEQEVPYRVVYVPFARSEQVSAPLGELRNRGHDACSCDIVVCMDDDDYYPPRRIESVLRAFDAHPDIDLAGCSRMLVHDYPSGAMYQFKAFRRRYLETHRHQMRAFGEEASFTNGFTEPMVQLSPFDTIIASNHGRNTVDKTRLVVENPLFVRMTNVVTDFMPDEVYQTYRTMFQK